MAFDSANLVEALQVTIGKHDTLKSFYKTDEINMMHVNFSYFCKFFSFRKQMFLFVIHAQSQQNIWYYFVFTE